MTPTPPADPETPDAAESVFVRRDAMTPTPPADPETPDAAESVFVRRLRVATYTVVLIVLAIYLLREFRSVLQPLFIAVFLGFLMHPVHRWLIRRGIRARLAYGVILIAVALGVAAFGWLMYANITQVADNLNVYEDRLEKKIRHIADQLPFETPKLEGRFLRHVVAPEQLATAVGAALGQVGDFTSWAALTLVYLFFMIAEKVSFPNRINLAFGGLQEERIMGVVDSISQAIGRYIAVKTLVSVLAGLLSYAVLASFDLEFAATWGILIFLFNYIPYLGSLIAVSLPVILSFVQFDEVWKGIVIAIALVGIQQVIGFYIEPRLTGRRLDVSPLLVVLSLVFWGVVWGIVGMILAVPLLVVTKIILDSINETKPIATLISNQ
jgi:predicted PurR-regulated permease PerM